MNDQLTVSTFQLFQMIPDAETARTYLEARLWPEGATCPTCSRRDKVTARKGGFYRCNLCVFDFTVRTGTIFERSHVPLHKWVYAMYLMLTSRKGISSLQLSKEIGITQKSAWFLLQRLREACGDHVEQLRGTIEIDETFIGGKEDNKHSLKKLHAGPSGGKTIILGMRERGGRVVADVVPDRKLKTIKPIIKTKIAKGSTVYTDQWGAYRDTTRLGMKHAMVNHSAKEYVRGDVHTNGIESVWALLKRGITGVYHHTSAKHLDRYVDEFTFRLNDGNVEVPTMDRIESLVKSSKGKRITYRKLIA